MNGAMRVRDGLRNLQTYRALIADMQHQIEVLRRTKIPEIEHELRLSDPAFAYWSGK